MSKNKLFLIKKKFETQNQINQSPIILFYLLLNYKNSKKQLYFFFIIEVDFWPNNAFLPRSTIQIFFLHSF
jgi:hypothetical protein